MKKLTIVLGLFAALALVGNVDAAPLPVEDDGTSEGGGGGGKLKDTVFVTQQDSRTLPLWSDLSCQPAGYRSFSMYPLQFVMGSQILIGSNWDELSVGSRSIAVNPRDLIVQP